MLSTPAAVQARSSSVTKSRSGARGASSVKKPSRGNDKQATKLFVLDTNVLMHDPTSLKKFQEHDIYIPMQVLSEMDKHKSGHDQKNRNVREASRAMVGIISTHSGSLTSGFILGDGQNGAPAGRLFLQTTDMLAPLPPTLLAGNGDNQILAVTMQLAKAHAGRKVILVTKDINMRIKAAALGIAVEDYSNDRVLQDSDVLPSGMRELPADFWTRVGDRLESWKRGNKSYYRLPNDPDNPYVVNEFIYGPGNGGAEFQAMVAEATPQSITAVVATDYTIERNNVFGMVARNREQNFAFNLLLNDDIHFVTITGEAGTGKTLLTLAAGLAKSFDAKVYDEIVVTRATVELGGSNNAIGYLPGDEAEKTSPWHGAVSDALEVLSGQSGKSDFEKKATDDFLKTRIKVKAMGFMRGRTFLHKFVVLDESQNLSPKEAKSLITRAGPGAKVVCLGNLGQIDTPYLTEGSSGLTYAVSRMRGHPICGHITMSTVERSALADLASRVL